MEKNQLGWLLGGFIALIIGIVFLNTIANSQTAITTPTTVNNETVALVNGTPVALKNSIVTSITTVYNATNNSQTVAAANFTLTQPQSLTLLNGKSGNYNVTYVYQPVTDTGSVSILQLLALMFAIGVLLVLLYYLSPSFREMIGRE